MKHQRTNIEFIQHAKAEVPGCVKWKQPGTTEWPALYDGHELVDEVGLIFEADRELRNLHRRVRILGQQAQRNDQSRYAAEEATNTAQSALQQALAENQQLKHMAIHVQQWKVFFMCCAPGSAGARVSFDLCLLETWMV